MTHAAHHETLSSFVERGCTAAEALDYYMTEIGPYNQTEWAKKRGVSQQTVSGNILSARQTLVDVDRSEMMETLDDGE